MREASFETDCKWKQCKDNILFLMVLMVIRLSFKVLFTDSTITLISTYSKCNEMTFHAAPMRNHEVFALYYFRSIKGDKNQELCCITSF